MTHVGNNVTQSIVGKKQVMTTMGENGMNSEGWIEFSVLVSVCDTPSPNTKRGMICSVSFIELSSSIILKFVLFFFKITSHTGA